MSRKLSKNALFKRFRKSLVVAQYSFSLSNYLEAKNFYGAPFSPRFEESYCKAFEELVCRILCDRIATGPYTAVSCGLISAINRAPKPKE